MGIFDSETRDVLQFFNWHKDKVRMLLIMPQQVEPCICAEVPFPDPEYDKCDCENGKPGMQSSPRTGRKRFSPKKQAMLETSKAHKKLDYSSQFSYLDNKYCMHNLEPESGMITSVGNGRDNYCIHMQSKEDKVQIFNRAALHKSAYKKCGRQQPDDIVLRTWRT